MKNTLQNLRRLNKAILLGSVLVLNTALLNVYFEGVWWALTLLLICAAFTIWALITSYRTFRG